MPRPLAALLALALAGPAWTSAIDLADTRLVADPATSGSLVAFAYANDVWVAASDGSGVRRLTSHPGVESGPALLARRPARRLHRPLRRQHRRLRGRRGGRRAAPADLAPRRRHRRSASRRTASRCCSRRRARSTPAATRSSSRCRSRAASRPSCRSRTRARRRSRPTDARSPTCRSASRSRSGSTTAAAQVSRILLFDNASYARRAGPAAERPLQRHRPDVDRRPALLPLRPRRRVQPLRLRPRHEGGDAPDLARPDFPVLDATAGGGRIAYEQAGYLHLLDPATGAAQRLKLGVAADLVETAAALGQGREVRSARRASRRRARAWRSSSAARS